MHKHLYLIGYRGTGKTTIAPLLAKSLNCPWHDADVELESFYSQTIREIFASEGEAGFRLKETATLRRLSQESPCVIATGGGVILKEENRDILSKTGLCFWLRASVETLQARINGDIRTQQTRPNLLMGGQVEIETILAFRTPIYAQCAQATIDVDDLSPSDTAKRILDLWTSLHSHS